MDAGGRISRRFAIVAIGAAARVQEYRRAVEVDVKTTKVLVTVARHGGPAIRRNMP